MFREDLPLCLIGKTHKQILYSRNKNVLNNRRLMSFNYKKKKYTNLIYFIIILNDIFSFTFSHVTHRKSQNTATLKEPFTLHN